MEFMRKYEFAGSEYDIFKEITFRIADSFDKRVVDECVKIAREEGIADLVLLNKHDIAAAWCKQIPMECTEEACPKCNASVKRLSADYCPHCGQKLKW